MSYNVHITRKAKSWADKLDAGAISLAEWESYVASDPEMQVENPPMVEAEQGYGATIAEAASAVLHPSRSRWLAYSKDARGGKPAWFQHEHNRITVSNPDEEILGKMLAVAQALHARVQGDDNEYFDLDSPRPSDGTAAARGALAWAASDFRNFQTFASAEAAQPLLAALAQQGILYQTVVDNGQLAFDPSFANNQLVSNFIVKLRAADFERGNQMLADLNQHALSQADPTHYLFSFTNEELTDILMKPDEWSSFDVALARQLLQQRGHEVSADTLHDLRQRRAAELAQPERSHPFWLVIGYVFALLGGLVGLLIGAHLYFHRKDLPDGRRIPAYAPRVRVHGLRMLVLGAIMFALSLYLRLTASEPVWQPLVQ